MGRRPRLRNAYCLHCGGAFAYRSEERARYCQSCGRPLPLPEVPLP